MRNSLLQLKGEFQRGKHPAGFSKPKLKSVIKIEHLQRLEKDLNTIKNYWKNVSIIDGVLLDIYYSKIIPKSSRVSSFFSTKEKKTGETIVGARFNNESTQRKHIFTHYISSMALDQTILHLEHIINIVHSEFNDCITPENIELLNNKAIHLSNNSFKEDLFIKFICDSALVEKFDIPMFKKDIENKSLISIFNVGVPVLNLLNRIGIRLTNDSVLTNTTIRLNKTEIDILKEKAPYLIAMMPNEFVHWSVWNK